MLKSVIIKNFRGIQFLAIDDLADINIFVGANGCGKTSVLEAFAVFGNAQAPSFFLSLSAYRDLPPPSAQTDFPVRGNFRDMDPANTISVSAITSDGENRELRIEPADPACDAIMDLTLQATMNSGGGDAPNPSPAGFPIIAAYKYSHCINGEKMGYSYHALPLPGMNPFATGAKEKPDAVFVPARLANSFNDTATLLSRLTNQNQENRLYQALRVVNPRVKGLDVAYDRGQSYLRAQMDSGRRLPVALLGDGFCRVCLIATYLCSGERKLLIIDEIDSGLHYSVMEDFWRSVKHLCRELGVQLFCSTHNEEMIKYAVPAFEDSPTQLKAFRVERTKNEAVSVASFDHGLLLTAKDMHMEVR